MPLPVKDSGAGGSQYGTGVFINHVTIREAYDLSGEKPSFLTNTPDLWIQLKLDVGRDFFPEMNFFGDFKRDDSRQISDWGSAFKVRNLFTSLGITGQLTPEGKFPSAMVEALPGKSFYRLQYVSRERDDGKLGYSDWSDDIETENPENLAKKFFKSVERGYPKNYHPELVDNDDDMDFPPKQEAPAKPTQGDPREL